MKGIIYVRVSSDEQVKGTSLDDQEIRCRKYCDENKIEPVRIFREEGASAKTAERKVLLEALEFCRKHRGEIGAFVVWKVDRFARNTEDHFGVRKLLIDYGTKLHSVTEPIGNDPAEKLFEVMLAGFAEFDNAIRKQRCSNGMLARLKQGIWPWKPPVGYTCAQYKKQGLKKTAPDEPDYTVFPIIQQVLKGYARGLYGQRDVAEQLKKSGFYKLTGIKPTSQFVDQLLGGTQLYFYAGILRNPWPEEDKLNLYIRGKHTPMINNEELLQIQAIKSGKKLSIKRDRYNPLFPLRRLVLCPSCKKPFTGSSPRGGSGKSHDYYHCHNRACAMKNKVVVKDDLENDFEERLGRITPTDEFFAYFREVALDVWKTKRDKLSAEAEERRKVLEQIEMQRKSVFVMRESGVYTDEQFKERLAEVENRRTTTKISFSETNIDKFDIEGAISYAEQFISDLQRQWRDLPQPVRPRFQRLLYPEGIPYTRGEGFGTAKLGCIFRLDEQYRANKSPLVDPRGVEPRPCPCHGHVLPLYYGPLFLSANEQNISQNHRCAVGANLEDAAFYFKLFFSLFVAHGYGTRFKRRHERLVLGQDGHLPFGTGQRHRVGLAVI